METIFKVVLKLVYFTDGLFLNAAINNIIKLDQLTYSKTSVQTFAMNRQITAIYILI